ncbi:MAG TPA: nickel-dependent hydrogenase large subunit [Spirochaetia bacterium]|nr:nickel-dependent hydrogenase large subunit [Spirochaetia bacterium]
MSIVLGYHKKNGREIEIAQDAAEIVLCDAEAPGSARAIIERRNGVIGNGSTSGDGVFDFRYGPFTGGYPEAGLVHYYTYGERILSVEVDLSLKHRGIEASLEGEKIESALRSVSRLCGNFSAAHTIAFLRAVESALGSEAPEQTRRFRIALLEIERIYNHLYVIMRLATAAAQKVLAAHLAALFEESLRIVELIAGRRRFGALFVGGPALRPGGSPIAVSEIGERLRRVRSTFAKLFERSLASRNYLDRLHRTAIVERAVATTDSLTGPSLRACGFGWDLRTSDPLIENFEVRTQDEADAFARMEVRSQEILDSCAIAIGQLARLGDSGVADAMRATGEHNAANEGAAASGLGATESASGTVAWFVELERGRVSAAHVSSPSVFGFQTYADAVVGNIFTDVPFAIDSFGISFADAGR